MPLAAVTALQAVRDGGRVRSGQRVLVKGGAGSVGSYAVQIARALGAEVTAVCSGASSERVRELGAAHVIDYTQEDFTRAAVPFDVLIDVVDNRALPQCLGILKPQGTYVAVGMEIDDPWIKPLLRRLWTMIRGLFAKQRVVMSITKPGRESLDALTEMIEAGTIAPAFTSRCELAELPAAVRDLETGSRRGKVVVAVQ